MNERNGAREGGWRPILPDQTAERVLDAVEEMAADVLKTLSEESGTSQEVWTRRGNGLAGGNSGLAFFFHYLAEARLERGYEETALNLLERAIEGTAELQAPPGLYGGFSGVAWTLEHLRGRLFEEDEGSEDPGEDVASVLSDFLDRTPWRLDYDLISGLVGYGVYALERTPLPGGAECLRKVVARLSETAERRPEGISWRTTPELIRPQDREAYPEGNFNLGVAHGVPGVIGFLGEACAAGLETEARPLLDGAVAWLLAQKLPPEAGSVFAYSTAPGHEPSPARLAWCYGDLGIAASLLLAARAVGQEEWEREALELARACAARPPEASGAVDAGICHGTAGISHLFNRLYQATGDPALREAALFWLERTLEHRTPDQGIGGYSMYVPDAQGTMGWHGDAGFLTGTAGVALALLAAATPVEPEWDRVLLSCVRPG
ncbi:MAG TPA: lanthionine synthetase C family protein [Thermoanaerobaculia bacterium]|nr:lanthionine synthetase C family protein [Thermoanaerobaculia bacterium]